MQNVAFPFPFLGMTESWMTSVTLKTTKTQHKTAHGDTLPEAALQTREAAGRSGALVSAAARPPLAPCPGLRLHSGPSVQAARLCCWGRRGGEAGSPEQPRRPQAPAGGRSGDLVVSCREPCEAEGRGVPLRQRWGEEEERRGARYGRLPGEGVCVKEQPLRGREPREQRRQRGPSAVCSHIGPNEKTP